MTDKKLTDNEIIKALSICSNGNGICSECPYSDDYTNCNTRITKDALDLINRLQAKVIKEQNKNSKLRNERNHLQAEIERLKECPKCVYEYDGEMTEYCVQGPCPNFKTVEQIKAEAYKEFAERLKEHAYLDNGITGFQDMVVDLSDIENIADEMAGEDNAKEKE